LARLVKKVADTEPDFLPNTRRIAALADEKKAVNIRAYDVRELTLIADSFVVCTATSEPHLKAIYSAVREGMRTIHLRTLHHEGGASSSWLVLDFGAIIFHVFRQEAREYYDLDGLWGDAPEISLGLDLSKP
jgi:ribosome-associated protein